MSTGYKTCEGCGTGLFPFVEKYKGKILCERCIIKTKKPVKRIPASRWRPVLKELSDLIDDYICERVSHEAMNVSHSELCTALTEAQKLLEGK